MIAPARLAAFRALVTISSEHLDLGEALARVRLNLRDERDRALAGEVTAGTLRWQGAFDHVIAAFARRPVARLDIEVLVILRLSIFQLLHLDRVPAAAIVDDAVELVRRAGKRSAAGFVNALLRRVSRERSRLPFPNEPDDRSDLNAVAEYLAVTLSHPRWLVTRWLNRHGYHATVRWLQFDNFPAPLTLRTNTLVTTREALAAALGAAGIETTSARFAPAGLIVTSGNPLLTPLRGPAQSPPDSRKQNPAHFFVQDEASQLVGEFVAPEPGQRVFDACASPGGKTTQMAAAMRDAGSIIAADVRGRRIDLLRRTVAESGARSIKVIRADARAGFPLLDDTFDVILLDVPCSGLGTVRRDPDIRWRRSESDLASLAAAQLEMLEKAASTVTRGGRLVYATCSSEPEENEQPVDAFLATHPEFTLASPRDVQGAVPDADLIDDRGFLRTLPFRHGLEAFFAARLVKARQLR